jgi:hypothetical protein
MESQWYLPDRYVVRYGCAVGVDFHHVGFFQIALAGVAEDSILYLCFFPILILGSIAKPSTPNSL